MSARRGIKAYAFDLLRQSAEANGGVGAARYVDDDGAPYCIHGHAHATGRRYMAEDALLRVGIDIHVNDKAVRAINRRRWLGLDRLLPFLATSRVSFAAWCKELGVERGR